MKIIYFGSGKFAVKPLEEILRLGYEVPLVITQPDRKKGRNLKLAPTPVKEYALARNLKIFHPQNINLASNLEPLKNIKSDVFMVVSYGNILRKEVLSIPKTLCINIHASLLPKFRGAAPINWALINGERKTGITFIKMNEFMDSGDIILQESFMIGGQLDAISLEHKLNNMACSSLKEVLKNVSDNKISLKKQDHRQATFAPLLRKEDGRIQWNDTSTQIFNRYRGTIGWPGSFTFYKGKMLKVLDMAVSDGSFFGKPGEITNIKDDGLEVACAQGSVLIKEVLPESHRKMSVQSFLAGHRIKVGEVLGR